MTKKLGSLLRRAEEFITNGQSNAQVAEKMAAYGYDAARWAEGQALLDTAKEQVRANEAAFAAQLGKTDTFSAAFDEAWDQSQSLARLCAELFKGQTEILRLLGLHQKRDASTGESEIAWPRKRNLDHFLAWARNIYAVAQENAEVVATLGDYGYAAERLSEEAAEVEAVAQADSEQEIAKAEAQQSTVERDEAVEALGVWMRKAQTVAKLALKDKRQLLELMGLRAQRR
ncbi:MAG: hypothetical protein GY847_23840 [Proteobacteria bacterium]|nr:hypothetical protein [Pseudomonadota bacterium]